MVRSITPSNLTERTFARKSSLDFIANREAPGQANQSVITTYSPYSLYSTINSMNFPAFPKPPPKKKVEDKRGYYGFETQRLGSFSHQIQTLKLPLNAGKNINRFTDLLKRSNSKEVGQMIETLITKIPKTSGIHQLIEKVYKKEHATSKKVKMVNKKTQTKSVKLKRQKSNKSSTKPVKKKSKKIDKKVGKLPKKKKSQKVSSKSSLHSTPFRTTSLGGQSLIFRTQTDQHEALTKSVNNLDTLFRKPKSKYKIVRVNNQETPTKCSKKNLPFSPETFT